MKNLKVIKTLKLSLLLFIIALISSSCEDNNVDQDGLDQDWNWNLIFKGFSIEMKPAKVSLKDYPLDTLYAEIAEQITYEELPEPEEK